MVAIGPSPWLFIIVGVVIAAIITALFFMGRKGSN
jgi:hypothetical protein